MDFEEQFYQIQSELYGMEYSKSSVKKALELLKLAEVTNDIERIFSVRNTVMSHANFAGEIELFMTSFAWCRAMVDKYPDRFSNYNITWKYKWAIDHAVKFPQISLDRINEMFEDLKVRSNAKENSNSIATLRMTMWRIAHDKEKLEEAVANFQKARRDYNSDCAACLADQEIQALLFLEREDEALKKAKPIIAGKVSCAEIPHYTYGHILIATHKIDPELAAKHHSKGYKMVRSHTLDFIHKHLNYLAETKKYTEALNIFEKQLKQFKGSTPIRRFNFAVAAMKLFSGMENSGTNEVSLQLPSSYKQLGAGAKYSTKNMLNWLMEESRPLASEFDERHGNNGYTELLKQFA